jgi:hypothetical protein
MPCPEHCVCPTCLEREFQDTPDLAALYLKIRKQIQATEDAWLKQDQARQIRRDLKRHALDRLINHIDLESKRRSEEKVHSSSEAFSI